MTQTRTFLVIWCGNSIVFAVEVEYLDFMSAACFAISHLKNPSKDFFFILDIDSTLVTTHQRNQAIVKQFVSDLSKKMPEDCKKLSRLQCQPGDYGYHSALKRINFQATNKDCLIELKNYWHTHFFSNQYLAFDQPTPEAVRWVQNLKALDIDFCYLTARHKQTMWEGTLSSMKNLGFPINEKSLFLKENLNDKDEVYKAKTLQKMTKQSLNKTLVLIDNEPVVLNEIATAIPDIELVWYESTHSGKMEPPQKALKISSFAL